MRTNRMVKSQRPLLVLALLTTLTSAAYGGPAIQFASGSYNLGSDSSTGTTSAASSSCGTSGTDALEFTGAGANNIGIHSYSCGFGSYQFGSRSSGENTYFVDGKASVIGNIAIGGTFFDVVIDSGQVGAFGSTSFGALEYQESQLTIKLTINGTTFLDEAFVTKIGEGGTSTNTYTSDGSYSVGNSLNSGAGYTSYSIFGGYYSFDISALTPDAAGEYDVFYEMTSMARGKVLSTSACRAPNYYGGGEVAQFAVRAGDHIDDVEVVEIDDSFSSYCGAGAQSGDPFPSLARAQSVPEPGSFALIGLAGVMMALSRVRRRTRGR